MFRNIIIVILLGLTSMYGCGSAQPEAKENRAHDVHDEEKENGHHEGEAEIIKLNPEAVKQAGIKTEAAAFRNIGKEYTFTGKISLNENKIVHVSSRIPGRAVEVYAVEGDNVTKEKPLALIDSPDIGEAQSQFLKAKTAFELSEKAYERAKIVLEGKVISTGEFQRREGEYLSSKTELKAAEDRLHLLGMPEAAVSSIGKEHTINSKVAINSPLSGTVIERHLTLGEVVEPVTPLFTIADLSNLWVVADVPETDIPLIKKGQSVTITVSSYPDKIFKGKISYISELIDTETRSVKVRAEVDNRNGRILKPDMFATVKILTSEQEALLTIPASSVQRDGDKNIVFVRQSDTGFEKRTVEIGEETAGFHPVISGIKEGEQIVYAGTFTLKSEEQKSEMSGHGH